MKKKKKYNKLHMMIVVFINTQVLFAPAILGYEFDDHLELLVWQLIAVSALVGFWLGLRWGLRRWTRVKFSDIF